MNAIKNHILTGLVFITGLIGLFSGEYIISSALFAAATYTSSVGASHRTRQ